MIVITNVEYKEVPNDVSAFHQHRNLLSRSPYDPVDLDETVLTETIKGRRFTRMTSTNDLDGVPNGGIEVTDVVIGMKADPANLLGLQFEAWQDLEGQRDEAYDRINLLMDETSEKSALLHTQDSMLQAYHAMPFWKRVLWALKGGPL